jgi:hypothetical protein
MNHHWSQDPSSPLAPASSRKRPRATTVEKDLAASIGVGRVFLLVLDGPRRNECIA